MTCGAGECPNCGSLDTVTSEIQDGDEMVHYYGKCNACHQYFRENDELVYVNTDALTFADVPERIRKSLDKKATKKPTGKP